MFNLAPFVSSRNLVPSPRRKKIPWKDEEEEMLRVFSIAHLILLLSGCLAYGFMISLTIY